MLFEDYHVLLCHNLFIYLLHKACVISYFADDVDHLLTFVSVFTTSMEGIWDSNGIPFFRSFWVFVLTPKICLLIRNPKGVIHRDIKVTNILTTPAGTVKLANLGSALWSAAGQRHNDPAGSLTNLSPKGLPEQPGQRETAAPFTGRPVDVWASGVTLLNLRLASHRGRTLQQLFANIRRGTLSEEAWGLIVNQEGGVGSWSLRLWSTCLNRSRNAGAVLWMPSACYMGGALLMTSCLATISHGVWCLSRRVLPNWASKGASWPSSLSWQRLKLIWILFYIVLWPSGRHCFIDPCDLNCIRQIYVQTVWLA